MFRGPDAVIRLEAQASVEDCDVADIRPSAGPVTFDFPTAAKIPRRITRPDCVFALPKAKKNRSSEIGRSAQVGMRRPSPGHHH